MKRILAGMLVVALMFAAGCQKTDDAVGASANPGATTVADATPDTEATPAPSALPGGPEKPEKPQDEPEAAPVQQLALADYQYETFENDTYSISFKHPTHWEQVPSEKDNIFAWKEPVLGDDVGAYMCVTIKPAGKIVVTELVGMDKLTDFHKSLKGRLTNYERKKGKRVKISGNTGFWFSYTCDMGDVPVRGYAALGYAPGKKRNYFVLFHYYGKAENYKEFDAFRKTIIKSIKF